jgi:spore coat protein U-like protein
MKKTLVPIALTFALVALAPAAFADSATQNLAVSANVKNNCTINTAPVIFADYDPVVANLSTALLSSGSVTIACTKRSAPTVELDLGLHFAGTVRNMLGGTFAEDLPYELYQPSSLVPGAACAQTTVWGTGASKFTPTSATDKNARTYNVCGKIAPGLDVGADAGGYTDTVVATVNF